MNHVIIFILKKTLFSISSPRGVVECLRLEAMGTLLLLPQKYTHSIEITYNK